MSTAVLTCNFCKSSDYSAHTVREMMFGTGESFSYIECSGCGCLRIAEIPEDLGKYYPPQYSAFDSGKSSLRNFIVAAAMRSKSFHSLARRRYYFDTVELRNLLRLKRGMKILDVGCGGGRLVFDLRRAGYNALGIDPFTDATKATRKCELRDIQGGWDFIMFNHSLEHIAEQSETLALAKSKLASGGTIAIRVPIVGEAWRLYGTDWVQFDAPRHLAIHSEKSFQLCAAEAGLEVTEIIHDSSGFQFWGSELVKRRIKLEGGRYRINELFTSGELQKYAARATELNRLKNGDQACFFLKPSADIANRVGS